MPTTQINGTELFYTEAGAGPPCLVLHGGLGGDHRSLHPWLDPLGSDMRLVYYDHRGHGRSGRPPVETITFDQLCADADALRAHLGFDHTGVLGLSYGGFIALEYALRYPARLSHLVLVGTAPAFRHGAEVEANARRLGATDEMLAALSVAPADDAALRSQVERIGPLFYHTRDAALARRHMGGTIWNAAAQNRGEELLAEYDVTPRLGEIRAPTLVLVGRDDFLCPPSQAAILHEGIPGSRLVIFERSGHVPFVEESDDFFAAVREWLHHIGEAAHPDVAGMP